MSLLGLGEFHAFGAAGQRFLYLVPSAAVFALDEPGLGRFDFSFRHDVNEEPGSSRDRFMCRTRCRTDA